MTEQEIRAEQTRKVLLEMHDNLRVYLPYTLAPLTWRELVLWWNGRHPNERIEQ